MTEKKLISFLTTPHIHLVGQAINNGKANAKVALLIKAVKVIQFCYSKSFDIPCIRVLFWFWCVMRTTRWLCTTQIILPLSV